MLTLLIVIISILALVKSAELFVDQAVAVAKRLRVSDFVIGLTIVGFGTSLPELTSTIFSTLSGHNQLVVANILGSNITNSCLILGVVAIFKNFMIRKRDVDINIPLNMAAIMVFWAVAVATGFNLNWLTGVLLIVVFGVLLLLSKEYNHFRMAKTTSQPFNILILGLSLLLLVVSGKLGVEQIVELAGQLNISETILGYFLLAVGTSLPELVTTWIAVKKNEGELAVGNILGSNLFNLLFVLGTAAVIRPLQLTGFRIDLVFLTVMTLATYALAIMGKKYSFSRKEGWGLVWLYILFVLYQLIKVSG